MRPIAPALIVLLLAALAGTGCRGKESLPPAPPEPSYALRMGNRLYRNWCAPCHGEEGRGDGLGWGQGRRPRPADLTALKDRSPRALEALLSESPKGSSCPSWKKNFTPSEIRNLAAWLEALGGKKKSPNGKGRKKEEGR